MKVRQSLGECIEMIASMIAPAAERPRREAELILMHHLKRDGIWIMTHQDEMVECTQALWQSIRRRQGYEPLEYIFGQVSFYSQQFDIAPGALIPRPETELLVDRVLEHVEAFAAVRMCEVGVGSGAISVILAQQLRYAKIIGVDLSDDALVIAAQNVERHGLNERITLRRSDLLDKVPEAIDVLVSNPPYVAQNADLEPNLAYEPALALFGGKTGMDVIAKLIRMSVERKIPLFCCEMGYDQRDLVAAAVPPSHVVSFYKDLAGLDRGFVLRLKE